MVEIRNILCAIDFSETSPKIASYAQTLARGLKAKVHVLYVAPSLEQYTCFRIPPTSVLNFVSETMTDAEKIMEKFIRENFTIADVKGTVLSGYTVEVILTYAHSADIDLIIMSTHGKKGVNRFLFGSVAEKVIKSSKIPVLSIRPE